MDKKHRMTQQKKLIKEILCATTSHPTADWIYEQAKNQLPNLSLGTVYRNLNVLRDMGEIQELNYGSTYSRYDGNTCDHYHFRCEACGNVFDLELPEHVDLRRYIGLLDGHRIQSYRLEFKGRCRECLNLHQENSKNN